MAETSHSDSQQMLEEVCGELIAQMGQVRVVPDIFWQDTLLVFLLKDAFVE